jgi:hypothetical protein
LKTFLIHDITNAPLKNWIKRKCSPIAHRLKNGASCAVYDTEAVIQRIHDTIKQHKHGNSAKYIPTWENYVKQIKEM